MKKSKIRKFSKKSGKKKNISKIMITMSVIVILAVLAVLAFKLNWVKITGDTEETEENEIVKTGFAAKVNDDTIDYQTLDRQYNLFFTLTGYPEQYKEVITKEKYLNQLIVESLLLQEAEKQGLTPEGASNTEVKEIVDSYIGQLQYSEEDFVKKLVENGLTIDEVLDYFRRQIVMTGFLNNTLLKEVSVDDKSVMEYYEENKEYFTAGEGQIRARHILVDTEEEANEILELLNSGSSFSELAKERSTDSGSAVSGGDLGFFTREQMIEEFSDAAFDLEKEGDISEPVQTMYGYHIIQKDSDIVSLEEAEDGIRLVVLGNKQRTALQDYLEEIKIQSEIIISEVE